MRWLVLVLKRLACPDLVCLISNDVWQEINERKGPAKTLPVLISDVRASRREY